MNLTIVFVGLTFFLSFTASAADNSPLLFQSWKSQQLLEAQNQVLRASARLAQLRAAKATSSSNTLLPTNKVKNSNPLTAAEKDLKRSQESLTNAQELTFADYVSIYVLPLQEDPEMVAKLAERLTRDELAEAFKCLMQQAPSTDAKRQSALLGSLGPSSSAHPY